MGEGGSLCEPVLSHSWFSSIEVVGGRGSVHTIFGSISVRSAVLGSSWLVSRTEPFDRQTLEIIPYGIPFYCITIYIKVIL
jgi:hypothetical protein